MRGCVGAAPTQPPTMRQPNGCGAPGHKTPGRRAASTSPPSFDDCLRRGGHSVVSIIRYVIYHAASTGIEVVAGIIIHCRIEPASTGARVERIRFESFAWKSLLQRNKEAYSGDQLDRPTTQIRCRAPQKVSFRRSALHVSAARFPLKSCSYPGGGFWYIRYMTPALTMNRDHATRARRSRDGEMTS